MRNPFPCSRGAMALAGACLLTACSSLNPLNWFSSPPTDKPAELKEIKTTLAVKQSWATSVGSAGKYIFQPAQAEGYAYTAATDGAITKVELARGRTVWRIEAKSKLSAGVGSDGRIVVVGTVDGNVLAFHAENGKPAWQAQVSSEILSTPAMAGELVLIRSVDGRITALEAGSGKRKWIYQRPLPVLTLRSPSGIRVVAGTAFVGFPGGKLVALSLSNGAQRWEISVANPKGVTELERIADVTGVPQFQGNEICAATYQGRVGCFDAATGETRWSREVSTATGLGLDANDVFVADETGQIFAYVKQDGASLWKQDQLRYRKLSQPLPSGRSVVAGDLDGVVHWLAREQGAFVARMRTDGTAIKAAPQLIPNGVLIQTTGGALTAFTYE